MIKKAIILPEVLLSVIIIWIGILLILTVVINSLYIAERVKLKTQWTFLANQGLEILYSFVETNKQRWLPWNCVKLNSNFDCEKKLYDSSYWQISFMRTWGESLYPTKGIYFIKPTDDSFENNRLYLFSGTYNGFNYKVYNYISWEKTFFARFIKVSKFYSAPDWGFISWDKILKITSYVLWKKWFYSWNVYLETFIWNF